MVSSIPKDLQHQSAPSIIVVSQQIIKKTFDDLPFLVAIARFTSYFSNHLCSWKRIIKYILLYTTFGGIGDKFICSNGLKTATILSGIVLTEFYEATKEQFIIKVSNFNGIDSFCIGTPYKEMS